MFYYRVEPYKHNSYMVIDIIIRKYNYESVILQTGVHTHTCVNTVHTLPLNRTVPIN